MLYAKFNEHPTSTEIVYELALTHQKRGNSYKPLESEDNRWELKKARNMCLNAIKKFPNTYGADRCRVLENQIKYKNLNVVIEKVNTPNIPFRANITFKNLNKVHFKLVKVSFDSYKKMEQKY